MALREDLEAGLEALAKKVKFSVPAPDASGRARLEIPIPPMLAAVRDGKLTVDIRMASGGESFTLSTPIATTFGAVRAPFLDALLRRQQNGDSSAGLSYALEAANQYDALLAVYHWILPSITPEQFNALYQRFLMAALRVIADVDGMIDKTPDVERVHPKRK